MLQFIAYISSRSVQHSLIVLRVLILIDILELLHWGAMGSSTLGFVIDDQIIFDSRQNAQTKAYRAFYAMKMLDWAIYNRDRWTELSNVDNYVYAVQVSHRCIRAI